MMNGRAVIAQHDCRCCWSWRLHDDQGQEIARSTRSYPTIDEARANLDRTRATLTDPDLPITTRTL